MKTAGEFCGSIVGGETELIHLRTGERGWGWILWKGKSECLKTIRDGMIVNQGSPSGQTKGTAMNIPKFFLTKPRIPTKLKAVL